jgi:arylsulfotransferase ASST
MRLPSHGRCLIKLVIRKRPSLLLVSAALALIAAGFAIPRIRAKHSLPRCRASSLDVQPFPGTPDAPPQTEIGFPAMAPAEIKELAVTGSRSGAHRGHLTALPGGHGTAFVPVRTFAAGERVSVRATLCSLTPATASGAHGARRISFSFTVAVPVRIRRAPRAKPARARRRSRLNHRTQNFRSERWLHPPEVKVSGRDPDPAEGDIFTDAQDNVEGGPLIFNPQGRLIYFHPLLRTGAFNVEVQQYRGQSVLTYWQGVGISRGHGVILNHHYQQVATVYAGDGYSADAHEFQVTPRGDAFITVYAPVRANLSSIGGMRRGILLDSIIQEINIATGKVVWEWHASGHVPLNQTHAGRPGSWPYDFFHINSIQQLPNGNLLISGRNTWSLYEINLRTGKIVFEIGGIDSSFQMGRGTNFEWQHDARMQPDGTITVFDNASDGGSPDEHHSRALRLRLDFRHRRVTLVKAFTSHPPHLSVTQGSVQPLTDGNTFVGWGAVPYFTEFGSAGRQRFSLHFPPPVESYRGYRFRWWGQPTTPPSIAAAATADGTTVYASWNGATEVASWRVLSGPSARALTTVGQYRDTSFETTMSAPTTQPYVAVQALDLTGRVLGTSRAVKR